MKHPVTKQAILLLGIAYIIAIADTGFRGFSWPALVGYSIQAFVYWVFMFLLVLVPSLALENLVSNLTKRNEPRQKHWNQIFLFAVLLIVVCSFMWEAFVTRSWMVS